MVDDRKGTLNDVCLGNTEYGLESHKILMTDC